MHPLLNHWRGLAAYLLAWALAGPLLAALLQGLGVAPFLRALPWAVPLCAVFAAVYACGLVLVHWPAGWFVVGLGRNGMEYSVLLLVCLTVLAWTHPPRPVR